MESCAERLSSGRARRLMTLRQAGSAEPVTVYGGTLSSELDETAEQGPVGPFLGDHPIDLIREDEATVNQSIGLEVRRPEVDAPHRLVFDQPYIVLGRSELCDLQLPHPAVSPRHAYLQRIDDRVMCVDLGSQTGTLWNKYAKIRDWVGEDDRLSIGPYEIGLGPEGNDEEIDAPAVRPRVELKVLRPNPRAGHQLLWPLRNCLNVIGRGRNCNIRVEHDSVSTAHCSLVLSSRGVCVVDLLSEPGTLVNGQRVRFARLRSGNELQIGSVLFRIMLEGEPAARRSSRNGKTHTNGALARNPAEVRAPIVPSGAEGSGPTGEAPGAGLPRFDPVLDGGMTGVFGSGMPLSPASPQHFSQDFVLSLMDQFAAMQMQQMNMMSEIFTGMQQRYLDFIRDDLSRVRELTAELQKLQAELLQRNLSSGTLPPPETVPAGKPAVEPASHSAGNGRAAGSSPPGTNGAQGETPVQPPEDSARPKGQPKREPRREQPENGEPDEPLNGHGDASSDGQYEWLLQRISEVERERNSRWKNILQTLSGAKANR